VRFHFPLACILCPNPQEGTNQYAAQRGDDDEKESEIKCRFGAFPKIDSAAFGFRDLVGLVGLMPFGGPIPV